MQWFCSPRKSLLQRKVKKISKSTRKKSRMKQKGDINTEPSSPKLLIRKLERRKFGKLCYFEILENIQKVTVNVKLALRHVLAQTWQTSFFWNFNCCLDKLRVFWRYHEISNKFLIDDFIVGFDIFETKIFACLNFPFFDKKVAYVCRLKSKVFVNSKCSHSPQ